MVLMNNIKIEVDTQSNVDLGLVKDRLLLLDTSCFPREN